MNCENLIQKIRYNAYMLYFLLLFIVGFIALMSGYFLHSKIAKISGIILMLIPLLLFGAMFAGGFPVPS